MVLTSVNLVLKRYWKSIENDFFKCVGTLCNFRRDLHCALSRLGVGRQETWSCGTVLT